jgi:hypothetical protein
MMAETGSYAERFGSDVMFNWSNFDKVLDKFYGITAEHLKGRSVEIADNGLEKGTNYESTDGTGVSNVDVTAKEYQEMKERAKTAMRRLPTYLFLEENKVDNVTDIVYINNNELFTDSVGLTIQDFKELCELFIKTDRMDRCIMAYNQVENMQ